ncbi:TPA: tellurite resistance TerB family protein [Klebsiella aerogenes]|nr:tellurite resistance TerB family protein [Klebsiella aerogenes]
MFGFGKNARRAKDAVTKAANKDFMEAMVAGMVWIASADGELEAEELDRIEAACQTNDRLAHFSAEITTQVAKYKEKFERMGAAVIRFDAKRELADLKHDPDLAAEVFVNMVAIAQADGEIEPAERKALDEVGRIYGLRVEDFE